MDLIAVCGKSNCGKSTFFSAATLVDVEISNRIFTTIQPNVGVAYVTKECPCKKLEVSCNPQNSKCENGIRMIPIKMMDIAGLVPDAHKGRGLGNKFLSDIMEARGLIHIVDISGGTDKDGNPVSPGSHDPLEDIKFFEREINFWILGILTKNWDQIKKKLSTSKLRLYELIAKQLTGLGITEDFIKEAVEKTNLDVNADERKLLEFVGLLRKKNKPILVAANKIDVPSSKGIFERVKKSEIECIPCSAESELALRRASKENIIRYVPGDNKFEILDENKLNERQKKALEFIQKNVLDVYGSTGVQQVLNKAIFDMLNYIVVYPVENETHFTNKKNQVLPDAILLRKGSAVKDLAEKVHSEIAENIVCGIDAKTKQKISKDHELKDGDIIKIIFKK
jgi:hypothetical protein